MEYDSVNEKVLELVPQGCRRVLDLGCGGGSMGALIRERFRAEVTGVTFNETEAEEARQRLDRVHVADLNALQVQELEGPFDCVLCSHVLEHLYRPDLLLVNLREVMSPGAALVVGLPNILVWRERLKLMAGRWEYTDGWLMDRTHYRFFDWRSAQALLADAGFSVDVALADGSMPGARFLPGGVNRAALKRFPGLFGWQFVLRGLAP